MPKEPESNVQKFLRSEISFYFAIIASIFWMAGLYWGLRSQMDLISLNVQNYSVRLTDVINSTAQRFKDVQDYAVITRDKVDTLDKEFKDHVNKSPVEVAK